jgi:hypothetical protein
MGRQTQIKSTHSYEEIKRSLNSENTWITVSPCLSPIGERQIHTAMLRMLKWFPRLQVATACFSCSPPYLNFLYPSVIFTLSLFHIYVHA